MREIRNRSIIECLSERVRRYGIEKIAPALDKAPSSLYAELNPYGDQSKSKLSLDDALGIMQITQDCAALEILAATLGFALTPLDVTPSHTTLAAEIADDIKALSHFFDVCTADKPSKVEIIEALNIVIREIKETGKLAEGMVDAGNV